MRGYKLIALIISGICVVLFVIIGMNVFGLNNKDDGYDVDNNYVSVIEKEQEPPTVDQVKDEIENEVKVEVESEVKEVIKSEIEQAIKQEIEEQPVNNETNVKDIKDIKEVKEVEKDASNDKINNIEIIETNLAPIEYTGNKWVDDKIVENKDQISDADLQSGLAIGDKIDTDLVMAYLEDGLTDDEKESLKTYLKTVLSDSEYQTVKVLIGRYSSMID